MEKRPLVYRTTKLADDKIKVEAGDGFTYTGNGIEALEALMLLRANSGDIVQFLWDIDQSLAPCLQALGEKACRELRATNKLNYRERFMQLFYIPSKLFEVKQGPRKGEFYDLAQYFPEDNPQTIDDMQKLAEKLFAAVQGEIGIEPLRWTSPARFMKDCILKDIDLPLNRRNVRREDHTLLVIPDEVAVMALNCSGQLWTEAHELGHFTTVYDYDISAAYPSEVCKMIDPRCVRWYETETDPPADAKLGYLEGRITVDAPISPIMKRDDSGNLYCPAGSWDGVFSLSMLRFLLYHKIGTFEMERGWYGIADEPRYPMADVMQGLYQRRKQVGPLAEAIVKRMMAAFYGLTLQHNDDGSYGEYFNPIWGCEISTRITLRVADFIYRNKIQPIHIGVDGIMTEQAVDLPQENGMGSWRLSSTEPAIVLGSGLVYQGDKHPASLYYKEILEMLQDKPNAKEYEKQELQVCTLSQALTTRWENIGKSLPMTRRVEIREPWDRVYKPAPKTGKDILTRHFKSVPIVEGF